MAQTLKTEKHSDVECVTVLWASIQQPKVFAQTQVGITQYAYTIIIECGSVFVWLPTPHTNCEPHRGPPMRLPIDASLIIAPLNGRSCWFSHTNITVSCCLTKANITLCWQLRRQLRARDRESGKQTDWLPDWLMAISREGRFYFQMQANFNVDTAGAKARH